MTSLVRAVADSLPQCRRNSKLQTSASHLMDAAQGFKVREVLIVPAVILVVHAFVLVDLFFMLKHGISGYLQSFSNISRNRLNFC